jgi:hypothetical protein
MILTITAYAGGRAVYGIAFDGSIAGIAESISAVGMDICLLCFLFVV